MRLIRLKEVMSLTGLGRSSIYKFMAAGTFPQSIALGERAIAWEESEIEEWVLSKVNVRDEVPTESIKDKSLAVTEADVIAFINERFKVDGISSAIAWMVQFLK